LRAHCQLAKYRDAFVQFRNCMEAFFRVKIEKTFIRDMKTTRRNFLVSAGLAMAFPGLTKATVQATSRGTQEKLTLWYEQPAGP
jgi:hypothetical protein